MILKIGEVTEEQFDVLTAFLASKANLLSPPASVHLDAYKRGCWTNAGGHPVRFAILMDSKLNNIDHAVTLQTVDQVMLRGEGGFQKKYNVPCSYLLELLRAADLYTTSFMPE